jgi:hypothetical protein
VKGRFNLFQTAMLRWRDLHPYSAVHAIRIDQPLDAALLASVIDGHLESRGLTGLELDVARGRFEYAGGKARSSIAIRAGGHAPLDVLEREIERELNTPFAHDGSLVPFRFFVVDAGAYFHLALTYDHFIAAGDSIVVLLAGIHDGYFAKEVTPRDARPYQRYPATCLRLFRRHPGALLRGVRRLGELAASCRRSVRPRYPGGADLANAFAQCRIEPADFSALVRTAKAWHVTVNDLLLALLLKALEPVVGERPLGQRRRELAVASIVNLRRDFGYDVNTTFGQFLSSFRVSHPMPPGMAVGELARDIHAETQRVKGEKLYLQNLLAIGTMGLFWRFLSVAQRASFHAKNYPAWGAITMVNVDPLWTEAGARPPPPTYLRAVSTGPLAPLILAVTTSAGVLQIGFSYRTTAFTRADIDAIATAIVDGAHRLADG